MLVRKPAQAQTRTRIAVLTHADKAGRGTAAQLRSVTPDGCEYAFTVFAFAGAAQGRLVALAHNAERWETGVRITTTTNAKGYEVVKAATDIELVAMAYLPAPKPTLRQHLGAYLQAWGQRLAA